MHLAPRLFNRGAAKACQGNQVYQLGVKLTLPRPSCVTRRARSYRSSLSDFTTATRRPAACIQRTPLYQCRGAD